MFWKKVLYFEPFTDFERTFGWKQDLLSSKLHLLNFVAKYDPTDQ